MKLIIYFLIILIFILSTVFSYEYIAYVNLGSDYFKPVDGSIKLKIYGINDSAYTFRLVDYKTLKPNATFKNKIEINYRIEEIVKVSVYFTLPSNYLKVHPNYLFNKPIIYLDEIKLSSSTPGFKTNLKSFKLANPHEKIRVKDEYFLTLYFEI